jgi:ribosomal protein S18 acetylase RimI-like enzyme
MTFFRNMTHEDIASGLMLCRYAGWNQVSEDWQIFLDLNPTGCRVAFDEAGKVVGTVTTISYDDHFSWIGMVLVLPEKQRQAIGTQLLMEALQLLSNQSTVKLDATPAGRNVYLKLNFVDEYRINRMHHDGNSFQPFPPSSVRAMLDTDFPDVFKLDCKVFGADRRGVLERNYKRAPKYALVAEAKGQISGFCFGRPGYNFDQIGPVIAQRFEEAHNLLLGALSQAQRKPIIVDAPDHSPAWTEFLSALGIVVQRPFIRMYRGSNSHPGVPAHQFAITGPEFG